MKKLILTLGIFLAGIFFVNAQDKTAAAANKLVNHLTEVCALTPDQVSKLQPIATNYVTARKANKQRYANNPDSLKIANKALTKDYKAQRDAVLTADQQQKLKDYNKQQKAANKQDGQGTDGDDQDGGGQK